MVTMTGSTIAILLLTVFSAGASGLATVSDGGIQFAFDTAVFKQGASETLLLEVYQEVEVSQFSKDSDNMSLFTTEIALSSEQGDTLAWDIWNTEVQYSESGSAVNCTLLPVNTGTFTLAVRVTDVSNGIQGVAVSQVEILEPEFFSDIELARTIMPAVEGSVSSLRKGNLIVFPAASTIFSVPGESMLYTYQELYSLAGSELQRHSMLMSPEGIPVFARPSELISIPSGMETVALIDSFDLSVARYPGLYSLSVTYTQAGDTLAAISKPMIVEVSNPVITGNAEQLTVSQRNLEEFPLLLGREETALFSRLDEAGQILYYDTYWGARPGEHSAFLDRSRIVAVRFPSIGKAGWETDMGRVFLIYGDPDEVEANPFSTTMVPFESWSYYGAAQDTFVFADLMGNGDFLQIYSTVEGEVSNPNWQSMLQNVNTGEITSGEDF
jgi:GWxTD domain-containing protein